MHIEIHCIDHNCNHHAESIESIYGSDFRSTIV